MSHINAGDDEVITAQIAPRQAQAGHSPPSPNISFLAWFSISAKIARFRKITLARSSSREARVAFFSEKEPPGRSMLALCIFGHLNWDQAEERICILGSVDHATKNHTATTGIIRNALRSALLARGLLRNDAARRRRRRRVKILHSGFLRCSRKSKRRSKRRGIVDSDLKERQAGTSLSLSLPCPHDGREYLIDGSISSV